MLSMKWWLPSLCARVTRAHAPLQYVRPIAHCRVPEWLQSVRFQSNESGVIAKEKVHVELRDEDLDESFVKGWGKGGQKINKVRNCVLLKHVPTGLHVRCQETRSLDGNRRIARRLLLQKLDDQVNGELSKRSVKISKLRKKKANRKNKSKQKYAAAAAAGSEETDSEGEDDDEEAGSDSDAEDEEDYDAEDAVEMVDFDVEEHAFRAKKK